MTTRHAKERRPWRVSLGRFFRTPKGLLLILLALLLGIAVPSAGFALVLPGVCAAVAVSAVADLVILRIRKKRWEFPSGAILTALLVVMVLSPHEPWYVGAVTSVVGVLAKYVFRTKAANVFNPAALGLVATFYVFSTGQSWWGALPEVSPYALIVLFATGIFISDRVNKMPLVLSFLGSYYFLFTLTAFVGDPRHVVEIYREPDLQAVLFFAFFILTDPPTSPVKYRPQIVCGVMVAAVSYLVFQEIGAAYYLLAGVLVGNVWEAWRRLQMRKPARQLAISASGQ